MNAILFNCSPHKKGNTFSMLNALKKSLEANGIDAEIMQVGGEKIAPCKACGACGKLRNKKCVFDNDILNSAAAKAYEADAVIIGSPTYYAAMTPEAKALIDRTGFVNFNNGGELLRGKVGAAVVAQRRGGATSVFSSINFFFLMSQMIGSRFDILEYRIRTRTGRCRRRRRSDVEHEKPRREYRRPFKEVALEIERRRRSLCKTVFERL